MKHILFYSLTILILSSCTTYQLPLSTLQERFTEIETEDLKEVGVKGPFGETYIYKTHPSETVELLTKSGETKILTVKPSLEMRVTHDGGKRSYFYFDKVFLKDKYLYGDRSRFSNAFQKKIPIEKIEKIEVQDGKKNFKYVTE